MGSGQRMRSLQKQVVGRRGRYLYFFFIIIFYFFAKYPHLLLTKPQIPALAAEDSAECAGKKKIGRGGGLVEDEGRGK